MTSIVIGATGVVGGHILRHLVRTGERPFALSRSRREIGTDAIWLQGDLTTPDSLHIPACETLFCTSLASYLVKAMPKIYSPKLKRVIVVTSASIVTKINSEIEAERNMLREYAASEQQLIAMCEARDIQWTILRPTIIYEEGRDGNITRLARLIRRFGFIPLAGLGAGLRQPVHAEDVAIATIAAARSDAAKNKIYVLSGKDTISYREMVGRIFDGMRRPRLIVPVPPFVWKAAFSLAGSALPNANVAMGSRMACDMIFDSTPATQDFGWNPREFRPRFETSARD